MKKRNNPYDPVYISKREGISLKDAEIFVENYKKNKATNLKNFIRKHGEVEGTKMFEKFRKTSNNKTKEYFKSKYGDEGEKLRTEIIESNKVKNKRCVEYYISKGSSKVEAEKLVSEYQKNNSGVHLDYYLNKGWSAETGQKVIDQINESKRGKGITYKVLKELCNDRSEEELSVLMTFIKSGYIESGFDRRVKDWKVFITEDFDRLYEESKNYNLNLISFKSYSNLCRYMTIIDNNEFYRNNSNSEYQIDHKFSIKDGFDNNVPLKYMTNIVNLQVVTKEYNLSKASKSIITLEELEGAYHAENN